MVILSLPACKALGLPLKVAQHSRFCGTQERTGTLAVGRYPVAVVSDQVVPAKGLSWRSPDEASMGSLVVVPGEPSGQIAMTTANVSVR